MMSEAFFGALHADPWTTAQVDVPELNQAASDLLEQAVTQIREQSKGAPAELRTKSLVLLGPPGTGKTHLFGRVRKHCGPRAIFVHLRPLLHTGLTASYVLSEAMSQLAQPSFGRAEWQADVLVGSLIARLEGKSSDFPVAHLSAFRELDAKVRQAQLEDFTDKLLDIFPDLDDVFVERLLGLPFAQPRQRRALLSWLGGQDCDPGQLSRIGASSSMDPANTVRALRTLGCLAALGSPLVIVFDQLENLIQRDTAEERVTQYGHLVTELVDSTRGLFVVQMALDSEWEQGILPRLNMSQRSRVAMTKSSMALPSAAQARMLLARWCEHLDEPEGPFPWPLTTEQVDQLTRLPGVTPRMLLSALKEAREGTSPTLLDSEAEGTTAAEPDPDRLAQILAEEWHERLVAAHQQIDAAEERRSGVDVSRLVDGILLASEFDGAALKASKNPYCQIEPRAPGHRWLSLLHQSHHSSLNAALDRALARGPNEPGLLVREQWRAIPPSWQSTQNRIAQTHEHGHLHWYDLAREEVASLLALEDLLQLARSRDLCDSGGRPIDEAQVIAYLRDEIHPESWGLMEAAQSDGERSVTSISPPEPATPSADSTETASSHVSISLEHALSRLHVASVDRLIREVRRTEPSQGRSSVVEGLERLGDRVKWFGRNIVAWGAPS